MLPVLQNSSPLSNLCHASTRRNSVLVTHSMPIHHMIIWWSDTLLAASAKHCPPAPPVPMNFFSSCQSLSSSGPSLFSAHPFFEHYHFSIAAIIRTPGNSCILPSLIWLACPQSSPSFSGLLFNHSAVVLPDQAETYEFYAGNSHQKALVMLLNRIISYLKILWPCLHSREAWASQPQSCSRPTEKGTVGVLRFGINTPDS